VFSIDITVGGGEMTVVLRSIDVGGGESMVVGRWEYI